MFLNNVLLSLVDMHPMSEYDMFRNVFYVYHGCTLFEFYCLNFIQSPMHYTIANRLHAICLQGGPKNGTVFVRLNFTKY